MFKYTIITYTLQEKYKILHKLQIQQKEQKEQK